MFKTDLSGTSEDRAQGERLETGRPWESAIIVQVGETEPDL